MAARQKKRSPTKKEKDQAWKTLKDRETLAKQLNSMAGMQAINAIHAAGKCRRQVKNLTNFVKNDKIVEFHDHIWNHHEKCIQRSTNMPGIGSLIREIDITISEI